MKIIAAFAFLTVAYASPYSDTVQIALPFQPEVSSDSAESAHIVKVAEPKPYKDIPAANPPFDPNVPILRSNVVFRNPVVADAFEELAAPQYDSPIDMGMIMVPEEVMRAVAAADALNAEPVPLFPSLMPGNVMPNSEDLTVKVVDTPMEPEQVQRDAPVVAQPVVLPEPAVPYVESDVAFNLPMEPELSRFAPSELDAVIVESPVLPIQMQIPAMPFAEAEDNLAVMVVDSPLEPEEFKMAAELDAARAMEVPFEVDQPEEFVNLAEMPVLLQNENRPYPVYNNPLLR